MWSWIFDYKDELVAFGMCAAGAVGLDRLWLRTRDRVKAKLPKRPAGLDPAADARDLERISEGAQVERAELERLRASELARREAVREARNKPPPTPRR